MYYRVKPPPPPVSPTALLKNDIQKAFINDRLNIFFQYYSELQLQTIPQPLYSINNTVILDTNKKNFNHNNWECFSYDFCKPNDVINGVVEDITINFTYLNHIICESFKSWCLNHCEYELLKSLLKLKPANLSHSAKPLINLFHKYLESLSIPLNKNYLYYSYKIRFDKKHPLSEVKYRFKESLIKSQM